MYSSSYLRVWLILLNLIEFTAKKQKDFNMYLIIFYNI